MDEQRLIWSRPVITQLNSAGLALNGKTGNYADGATPDDPGGTQKVSP